MASLETTIREQEAETLIETTNAFKQIEQLVRMGLMPVTKLPYLKRAFVQMESGAFMPSPERQAFYGFIQKLLEVSLTDPTILRQIKNKTASMKNESHELDHFTDKVHANTLPASFPGLDTVSDGSMPEGCCEKCGSYKRAVKGLAGMHCLTCDKAHISTAVRDFVANPVENANETINGEDMSEAVDLKKTPQGMLQTMANIMKNKKRAGGKPTPEDKKMATRAKNELRRRRHMGEEVELEESKPHPVTKKEWSAKHKDHKHQIGKNKYLMVHDPVKGTILKPVQVTENYKQAFEVALSEYGVETVGELGDLTNEFFAVVEAAIEPRSTTSHSDEIRARVKADMEKRRAAKETAMSDAKKELESATSRELKKGYRNQAFKIKKEND